MPEHVCDRPLAAKGYTSYRCRGRYGWIMIGAVSEADALNEARRSGHHGTREDLQIWNGTQYQDLPPALP